HPLKRDPMLYSKHMRCVALVFGWALATYGQSGAPAQAIFEIHCVSCHGAAQMSGLDLRQRETILKGGRRGPAIVPGKPGESLLYRAIAREGELQMPPGKQPLEPGDIARLREWIAAGAPWDSAAAVSGSSWWAFRPLARAAIPRVNDTGNPIDAFLTSRLEEKGLHPVSAADRATLVRRAY